MGCQRTSLYAALQARYARPILLPAELSIPITRSNTDRLLIAKCGRSDTILELEKQKKPGYQSRVDVFISKDMEMVLRWTDANKLVR